MTLLALLIGFVLGGLAATAACALWAFRAMHPHDELSDLERYAARRAEEVE